VSCYIGRKADKGAAKGSAIAWADFALMRTPINCKLVDGGLFGSLSRHFQQSPLIQLTNARGRLPHPTWERFLYPRVELLADRVLNVVANLLLRGVIIP
jgi:hypothetical protein